MEIYVADVRSLADEQVLMGKCELLWEERKRQVRKLRRMADKQRCVGAGLLLEYGLRQRGYTLCDDAADKVTVHIAKNPYGKPYLKDRKDLHFNLSHSGDYVAAVFAACEAGVDIERIRTAKSAVACRFFTKDEREYLHAVCAESGESDRLDAAFFKLWTRKESYIKAVGEGMHLPLTDFCVVSDRVKPDDGYCLETWKLAQEDYVLSVCAKAAIEASLKQIDLMKMI